MSRPAFVCPGSFATVAVLDSIPGEWLLESLAEDQPRTHEQAVLEVCRLLRPGHPVNLDRARQAVFEKFRDPLRYCLGTVARFRIERKLAPSLQPSPEPLFLTGDDLIRAVRYLLDLSRGKGQPDDIDDLANRRVRLVDELLAEQVRESLFKLRRVVQDRMRKAARRDLIRPHELVNPKVVAAGGALSTGQRR
jgi:DNA-directed RNA polymerase subunit beta